ncbi:hypothetical protein BHE74_00058398 [Ensete ventricosum]|nr:hypothetical protein BHE74_00058398 [Ensete ventricosum]
MVDIATIHLEKDVILKKSLRRAPEPSASPVAIRSSKPTKLTREELRDRSAKGLYNARVVEPQPPLQKREISGD